MVNDMTKGSPAKLIIMFAIPMLIGNVFQQLYNMVDTVIVGRFVGAHALAAVGATGPLIFFLFAFLGGFATGVSIIISQLFGAGEHEKLKTAFSTAIISLSGFAILMTIIMVALAKPMLYLMKVPEYIFDDAYIYVIILFAGIIFAFGFNLFASIMRGLGDSRTPLYFLILASLLNIALDYLFVVYFGWGVPGVAIATVMAQAVSAALCIFFTFKRMPMLRLSRSEFKFDKDMLKAIVKYGFPASLQQSIVSVGSIIVQGVVNGFGPHVIAAATAANRLNSFATMPMTNISVALSTFVGQNLGAGYHDRAKKGYRITMRFGIILTLVLSAFVVLTGPWLLQLFVDPSETVILGIGAEYLSFMAYFYVVFAIMYVNNGFLTGSGDVTYAMASNFVTIGCRVIMILVLSKIPSVGYKAIWIAGAGEWVLALISMQWRYLSGRWKNKILFTKAHMEEGITATE